MLKIEGDNVSAAECSHHIEMLKGNILLRKTEKYCDAATEKERESNQANLTGSQLKMYFLASFNLEANSSKIFQQFGLVKSFCSDEKIAEWNTIENKVSTECRWVQIFQYMHQLPFEEFAHLIEFVLCFLGTSAPVERVFAKAKKIWTPEKSNLHPSTLKSILIVKNNMENDCAEFYEFLKKKPDLFQKISCQETYEFKKPKENVDKSPGAMSIDTLPEED